MTLKEKLLFRLQKRWHTAVLDIEVETDLIDGYKYMVYIKSDYALYDGETSFPCRSLEEARSFIRAYSKIK